jgi:hypothetical protein
VNSLDSRTQTKLLWVGVLLSPVIAVQGVRLLLSDGIAPAVAETTASVDTTVPATVAKGPSPKQKLAMEWIEKSSPKVPKRSPFEVMGNAHLGANTGPASGNNAQLQGAAVEPAEPPPPPDDRPHHLRVSGIIGDASGTLAAIDGKLRRMGDVVAPSWTVSVIDARHRLIVLKHDDGRLFDVSLPNRDR